MKAFSPHPHPQTPSPSPSAQRNSSPTRNLITGVCDDGGQDAAFSCCDLGSDCNVCTPQWPHTTPPDPVCPTLCAHPVPDRAAAACGRTAVSARFPPRMTTQATTGLQSARSSRPALALRMTIARARDIAQDRPILMKTSCARETPVASRCVPLASAVHARL